MRKLQTTLFAIALVTSISTTSLAGNIGGMRTTSAGNIGGMAMTSAGNIGGMRTTSTGNIGGMRSATGNSGSLKVIGSRLGIISDLTGNIGGLFTFLMSSLVF